MSEDPHKTRWTDRAVIAGFVAVLAGAGRQRHHEHRVALAGGLDALVVTNAGLAPPCVCQDSSIGTFGP